MNIIKSALLAVAAMSVFGTQMAVAAESPVSEQYSYGKKLDIAKVISLEEPANVCSVVPVHMTYLDHEGHQHVMEYHVMGTGCTD
ncbi:DUF2790 domain-containing protein [Pseudomonas luteola]